MKVIGYVKEEGNFVSRTVRIYNRATGVLINSTVSNPTTGYFVLTVPTLDPCFVIVLDDITGENYNVLIKDKIIPMLTF